MPKPEDRKIPEADYELERVLAARFSNLHGGLVSADTGGVYALYLRCTFGGVWTAVAKRYAPGGGGPQVAFGRGASYGKALRELNRSIASNKWKEDKPYSPAG